MDLAELIIKLRTGHYQRSPRGWSRDRWATVRGGGLIESCRQGRGGGRDRWRRAGLAAQPRSAGLAAAGRAVVAGTVGRAVQQRHGGHLPSDGSQGSGQSGAHHQAAAPAVIRSTSVAASLRSPRRSLWTSDSSSATVRRSRGGSGRGIHVAIVTPATLPRDGRTRHEGPGARAHGAARDRGGRRRTSTNARAARPE